LSRTKKFLGVVLIIATFSLIFILNIPSFLTNSTKVKTDITVELDFLKNNDSKIALLYFGYVGCQSICTPALQNITEIYNELDSKNLNFYFINLLTNITPEIIEPFVKAFHKDFNGIYLNKKELQAIEGNFRLNLVSLEEYSLNHSGFLYLLVKENNSYKIKNIYVTKPFDKEQILKDVENLI